MSAVLGSASSKSWLQAVVALAIVTCAEPARAASLDDSDEIRLGLRTYAGARIGSEEFHFVDTEQKLGGSFPASAAGHVRQLRYFTEVSLNHDLDRLVREGWGPLALLRNLPVRPEGVAYSLVFRGEYDGVYDFGPSEFRTAEANRKLDIPLAGPLPPDVIGDQRRHLRDVASHRERLFQAYVEANFDDLYVRFGRQILAWGETDAFRLLDNINPTDSSFGGFLIPLDERRVPLDMLRLNYNVGVVGPFSNVFVEGYVAIDDEVAWDPGIAPGSPWSPPTIGIPNTLLFPVYDSPSYSFSDARGGLQLKLNAPVPALGEVTLGLAHYYTFLDIPAVKASLARGPFPGLPAVFPDDDSDGAGYPPDDVNGDGIPDRSSGAIAKLELSAPHTQITGGSASFAVPSYWARAIGLSGQPIVRTELAYFHDEPRFRQIDFEPLIILNSPECRATAPGGECSGKKRLGDSWSFVVGIDLNQYIRWLNPQQSFFFSTQFFYKHLNNAAKRRPIPGFTERSGIVDGEVAPVPAYLFIPTLELDLVHNPVDQYLQTFIAATSYRSGQINPALLVIYDWYGALAVQPQVTFSYDPFRFSTSYSFLHASSLKGASGVSLLRDRDNVFFQLEYVL